MVGKVGGRLVVEINHIAKINGLHDDFLVRAKLPIGSLQIDEIDPTKHLVLVSDRLRIVERGRDQIVEIDAFDIEDFLHMRAARAQKPRHLLLVSRAVELRFHRVWRCRHLTERKGDREDLDKERFHSEPAFPVCHDAQNSERLVDVPIA